MAGLRVKDSMPWVWETQRSGSHVRSFLAGRTHVCASYVPAPAVAGRPMVQAPTKLFSPFCTACVCCDKEVKVFRSHRCGHMVERTWGEQWIAGCFGLVLFYCFSCAPAHADGVAHTLVVTATAYNSFRNQTSGNPNVGAWGDRLKPGMKVIAVSRDLLRRGLKHGTRVIVQGLHGTYRVLDKMGPRWRRRIDIYMGRNINAARRWGKRKVRITWIVKSTPKLARRDGPERVALSLSENLSQTIGP